MASCSTISDGIKCLLVRHGIIEYLSQGLVTVVTPSCHSSTEGLTNERHAPHDLGEKNSRTGEANRVWIGSSYLILGFSK